MQRSEIVDRVLESSVLPRLLLFRAEIAAREGNTDLAWLSLHALSEKGMQAAPAVAKRGLALSRKLGPPPNADLAAKIEGLVKQRGVAPAVPAN